LGRELANNPEQQKASAYARRFQQPNAAAELTAEGLAFWVKDPDAREQYLAAFRRSSFEGMLNYYKANYPREPHAEQTDFPKVQCPVLLIHGLKDTALLADGLNGTWNYVADTLTLVTVPDASHFVQQDAAELVTKTITSWLESTKVSAAVATKSPLIKLSGDTKQLLKKQLGEAIGEGKSAGGMHLVVKDREELFFQVQGFRDIDDKLPMQRDTLVRIYSMSKPITSVAAMTLWEQGGFDLDDPVSKFIPEFKAAKVLEKVGERWVSVVPKRTITIRDCFRHTTGYGYGGGGNPAFDEHYNRERLVYRPPAAMLPPAMTIKHAAQALSRVPAFHHPGERFTYGFSTDLLGRLIEVWSGQPLDVYVKRAVLDPLEMKDTGFAVSEEKRDRFASCHTDHDGKLAIVDKATTSPFLGGFEFLSGGGGLVSTIDDYANFCQMMVSKGRFHQRQILKPETVTMMFTNQLEETPGDFRFGLGFAIGSVTLGSGDEAREATQTSWGGYASTDFRLVPAENLFQIFVRQRIPSKHGFAGQAIQRVYAGLE
jgi:CubicO group peptidase (beta-lactamase class C family)